MKAGKRFLTPVGALLLLAFSVVTTSYAADTVNGPGANPLVATSVCQDPNTWVGEYNTLISQTKQSQPELAEALRLFPKGADIHNHLSGSILPEDYIALGIADGDCYGPATPPFSIAQANSDTTCPSGYKALATANPSDRNMLMQSLSMYQYVYPNIPGGHDQFFATFGRFGAVSGMVGNTAPMLARLLQQANRDSVSYVETMLSFQTQAVGNLANQLRQKYPDAATFENPANYQTLFDNLIDLGLKKVVTAAHADINGYLAATAAQLKCTSAEKDPACDVTYAFQAAVNRNAKQADGSPDLAMIFTQTAFSMLLAANDERVVGVNLLSGEDNQISMSSFPTQMQFFAYFHWHFPDVNIALHAGELTPCFVGNNNPALKNHLTGSLLAGAKRIGHGVSFAYLSAADKAAVADLVAKNNALVEIMFTSNAQILGVAGDAHPFEQYGEYQVPMAFSTDDEGVSYADFTDEWLYGLTKYRLGGDELVTLARNSLQYSFIPGASLWKNVKGGILADQCAGQTPGIPDPAERCKTFLATSPKAKTQWDYEARLVRYWQGAGKKLAPFLSKKAPGADKDSAPTS